MSSPRRRGRADQRARAQLAPLVALGHAICWRCGQPIRPGQPWDADHPQPLVLGGHVAGPVVPTHARCNRSAGAALGNRLRGSRTRLAAWLNAPEFFPEMWSPEHPEVSSFSPPKPPDPAPTKPTRISRHAYETEE